MTAFLVLEGGVGGAQALVPWETPSWMAFVFKFQGLVMKHNYINILPFRSVSRFGEHFPPQHGP